MLDEYRITREDIEMLIALIIAGAAMSIICLASVLVIAFLFLEYTMLAIFALIGAVAGVCLWLYVIITTKIPIEGN